MLKWNHKHCSRLIINTAMMEVHKEVEVKIFAHAWVKVINEKTYRSFWKICAQKRQWGGENALALHNSQNTRVVTYAHPWSPHSRPLPSIPTSVLPFRLLVFAHAIPSELNTDSFLASTQAPRVQIPHITWPSLKVCPQWSLFWAPQLKAISLL